MELLRYLHIVRRRWMLAMTCVMLAVGTAVLFTASTAPQYAATTTFVISAPAPPADPANAYQAILVSQERAKSYAKLVSSQAVTEQLSRVLADGLTADELARRISASIVGDTVLLRVTVTDGSPARAERIAEVLGTEFARYVGGLERAAKTGDPTVRLTVADAPELPTSPASPKPLRNLAVGLLAGLVLGAAAAILRDLSDRSVKSTAELRAAADGAVLGSIEFDRKVRERPIVVQSGESAIAEAFRSLRTNLQFGGGGRPPGTVAVTSAFLEEGKSTVASNLAVTLAEAGWRVALVEADLRRPRLAGYLGIDGETGLTRVLQGGATLDEALRTWGSHGLMVLPAGPVPVNPSELLASGEMAQVLLELERRADMVLVDTSPLLSTADASVVCHLCAGTLLVARAGRTRRDDVAEAAERLRSVDGTLLGAVLNFAPSSGATGYGLGVAGVPTARRAAAAGGAAHERA